MYALFGVDESRDGGGWWPLSIETWKMVGGCVVIVTLNSCSGAAVVGGGSLGVIDG